MAKTNINIQFPFKDSQRGFYVELTQTDKAAIKSDLMHLILTNKGERYMMPSFGTDLLKFIFHQNDILSHSTISQDIKDTVKKYLPNLQITKIDVKENPNSEYAATVRIEYIITEGVFEESDFILINV